MPLRDENGLKEPYARYEERQIRLLCSNILPEDRQAFLEKVQAKIVLENLKPRSNILKLITKKFEST